MSNNAMATPTDAIGRCTVQSNDDADGDEFVAVDVDAPSPATVATRADAYSYSCSPGAPTARTPTLPTTATTTSTTAMTTTINATVEHPPSWLLSCLLRNCVLSGEEESSEHASSSGHSFSSLSYDDVGGERRTNPQVLPPTTLTLRDNNGGDDGSVEDREVADGTNADEECGENSGGLARSTSATATEGRDAAVSTPIGGGEAVDTPMAGTNYVQTQRAPPPGSSTGGEEGAAGAVENDRPPSWNLAGAVWDWWSRALEAASEDSDDDENQDGAHDYGEGSDDDNDGVDGAFEGVALASSNRRRQRLRDRHQRYRSNRREERREGGSSSDARIPDWERRYWELPPSSSVPSAAAADGRADGITRDVPAASSSLFSSREPFVPCQSSRNRSPPRAASSFVMVQASHFDCYNAVCSSKKNGDESGDEATTEPFAMTSDGEKNGVGERNDATATTKMKKRKAKTNSTPGGIGIPTLVTSTPSSSSSNCNVVVLPGSELQKLMAEAMKVQLKAVTTEETATLNNGDGGDDYYEDEEECVICMEPFHSTLNPRMPTTCGCGDNRTYFHLPCLLRWVERDQNCPGCRSKLIWQEFGID